jgi:arylsulfatase A-like enzyme
MADRPRGVLPIPERRHVGATTYDPKDPETSFPPIVPLRPPAGAPNVLLILLDDVGFGASSPFGGRCRHRRLSSWRPADCAPLPETLRLNGYSTAQFGKCHEVLVWETSPLGPFDRRSGRGFEHFCGFIGGETTSD